MTKPRTPVEVTGTITRVERRGTSRNGNPTYGITMRLAEGGHVIALLTQTDGSIGYAADNYRPDSRETTPRVNTLHVDGRGRIVNITGPDRADALWGSK